MPRVLLVTMRDPDDPMVGHERACFVVAAGLGEDDLVQHGIMDGAVDTATLRRFDAVFFGGSGAYSVLDDTPWMPDAQATLRRTIDAAIPAWASCFGFQAVAKALGGTVVHDEALAEIGTVPLTLNAAGRADPLVGTLPTTLWVQEGHHDHVLSLPDGVTRLAAGEHPCEQLFRVDGTPFYASQFHPELDPHALAHRFQVYRDHYFGSGIDVDALLHDLATGPRTPEVQGLLARLVRWGA